jgi:AcrR family transcriptional regulator
MEQRILLKSHDLFMRYGVRSVSMDEIAAHLGISKKTIYQYYADKDALVEGVVEIEINRNEKQCSMQQQSCENAVHEIFIAVDMVQEMLTHMNPSLIFDLEKYHPKAFKKFNDHKNKFMYEIIKNNLDRGIAEGLYREEINTDILARFRLASTFLIFNPELFPLNKHSLPQILNEVTDNFLYGLTTAKGQKLIQKYKLQRQKQ